MAKERTIKNRAKEKLIDDGYVVWIPSNSRYGSGITHNKYNYLQGNDIFNVFDLICWRGDKMKFIQYTSLSNVSTRVNKILEFIKRNTLKIPEGIDLEVWGYEDRIGFTRSEKIIT